MPRSLPPSLPPALRVFSPFLQRCSALWRALDASVHNSTAQHSTVQFSLGLLLAPNLVRVLFHPPPFPRSAQGNFSGPERPAAAIIRIPGASKLRKEARRGRIRAHSLALASQTEVPLLQVKLTKTAMAIGKAAFVAVRPSSPRGQQASIRSIRSSRSPLPAPHLVTSTLLGTFSFVGPSQAMVLLIALMAAFTADYFQNVRLGPIGATREWIASLRSGRSTATSSRQMSMSTCAHACSHTLDCTRL
jgi:hypothetical protein